MLRLSDDKLVALCIFQGAWTLGWAIVLDDSATGEVKLKVVITWPDIRYKDDASLSTKTLLLTEKEKG